MMGSLDAVLNLPAGRQVYRFATGFKNEIFLYLRSHNLNTTCLPNIKLAKKP